LSSKLALILNATIWDDAIGLKLNAKPHQIVVIESLMAKTLISSSLKMSWRAQLENISQNAALSTERWMTSMMIKNRWFGCALIGGGGRKLRMEINKFVVLAVGHALLQESRTIPILSNCN